MRTSGVTGVRCAGQPRRDNKRSPRAAPPRRGQRDSRRNSLKNHTFSRATTGIVAIGGSRQELSR